MSKKINFNFDRSRIIFSDCLEILPLVPDNSIDIICTDPPYGKTKNPFDKVIVPRLLWPQLWRISKPKTAIILFGQDKFTAMMMLSSPYHRYNLIYEKTSITGHLNANRMPLRCHEDIMLFYKKLPPYHPQKPVKLIEDLLKTYSNPGGIVLDFASGSGTTGEACFNLKKNFILIEKDPEQFKRGQKRNIDIFQKNKIESTHLSYFNYSI